MTKRKHTTMPFIQNSENWHKLGNTFQFAGNKIFCVDLGPKDAPAILFLHGFPTSSYDFHRLVPALSPNFHLILPDFLGFGFSDKPARHRYSIFEHADMVEALANACGIARGFLLTHDMGNSVGLELLRRMKPGRGLSIQRFLMLNGGVILKYYQPVLSQRLLLVPALGEIFSRLISRRLFVQQFSSIFAPDKVPSPAELEELWRLINFNHGKRNYAKLIRYIKERKLHEHEWLEALKTSTMPFKLVWGQQDPVAVPAIGRALLEYRPDATVCELHESGHYPQLEVPEMIIREIRNFFH
jgi:pimeloyl-ACP methyl ester carboxylesterase